MREINETIRIRQLTMICTYKILDKITAQWVNTLPHGWHMVTTAFSRAAKNIWPKCCTTNSSSPRRLPWYNMAYSISLVYQYRSSKCKWSVYNHCPHQHNQIITWAPYMRNSFVVFPSNPDSTIRPMSMYLKSTRTIQTMFV